MSNVIHGWGETKSKTACGLGWIYGRQSQGKKPLNMVANFTKNGVTCKRCLVSQYLRTNDEKDGK